MIDLAQGDVLEILRQVPDSTFHACLTDPPYGLSFMGKHWDYDVPSVEVWREVVRVLRPGAAVLSFGGTRTYHRLVCNAEDGGLEVRDQLCWLYAKGFPKSLNVSKALDKAAGAERPVIGTQTLTGNAAVSLKDKGGTYGVQVGTVPPKVVNVTGPATEEAKTWDGYGTALKPAHEPILLARKPLDGTVAENVLRWGCGALDIDGCRLGELPYDQETWDKKSLARTTGNATGAHKGSTGPLPSGRWPANLLLDEGAAAILDQTVKPGKSTKYPEHKADGAVLPLQTRAAGGYSDSGGPSRFFFSSKVSTKERNEGCDSLPLRTGEVTDREDDTDGPDSPRNHHPTLKPIALARYLAQLIRPPGDPLILIPFAGAGSEVIGASLAGWTAGLAIERDPDYVQIARARIAYHLREGVE